MQNPCYILESHFRGVPEDVNDDRCHFRRYILDIYLENAVAGSGEIRLKNVNEIIYYFGNLPLDGINANITHETDQHGGAYNGVAFFTTSDITVKWTSDIAINACNARQKVATLLFCFSKWGMSYSEVETHTPNEILIPDLNKPSIADGKNIIIKPMLYNGVKMQENAPYKNPAFCTVKDEKELSDINFGKLLTHFAVLSDSHIGRRYGWENYNWLYGVYNHLEKIHKKAPLDFVLELGDNIDDGYATSYKADYDVYLKEIKKLTICDAENPIEGMVIGKIPHYELRGNHDTSPDTRFLKQHLWFAENGIGEKTAFIAFFTKYGGYPAVKDLGVSYKSYGIITDDMVEFVEKSIIKAKENKARHIVLCSHFGVSQDLEAPILPESGLGKIENLCKKYNIKLFLSGHEHNKEYTLRKYNDLYNYDASMTRDKYSVFEMYQKYAKVTIYNTSDNSVARIDVIKL